MPKPLVRIIALLLASCLIADPGVAQLARPDVWRAVTVSAYLPSDQARFEEEALAAVALGNKPYRLLRQIRCWMFFLEKIDPSLRQSSSENPSPWIQVKTLLDQRIYALLEQTAQYKKDESTRRSQLEGISEANLKMRPRYGRTRNLQEGVIIKTTVPEAVAKPLQHAHRTFYKNLRDNPEALANGLKLESYGGEGKFKELCRSLHEKVELINGIPPHMTFGFTESDLTSQQRTIERALQDLANDHEAVAVRVGSDFFLADSGVAVTKLEIDPQTLSVLNLFRVKALRFLNTKEQHPVYIFHLSWLRLKKDAELTQSEFQLLNDLLATHPPPSLSFVVNKLELKFTSNGEVVAHAEFALRPASSSLTPQSQAPATEAATPLTADAKILEIVSKGAANKTNLGAITESVVEVLREMKQPEPLETLELVASILVGTEDERWTRLIHILGRYWENPDYRRLWEDLQNHFKNMSPHESPSQALNPDDLVLAEIPYVGSVPSSAESLEVQARVIGSLWGLYDIDFSKALREGLIGLSGKLNPQRQMLHVRGRVSKLSPSIAELLGGYENCRQLVAGYFRMILPLIEIDSLLTIETGHSNGTSYLRFIFHGAQVDQEFLERIMNYEEDGTADNSDIRDLGRSLLYAKRRGVHVSGSINRPSGKIEITLTSPAPAPDRTHHFSDGTKAVEPIVLAKLEAALGRSQDEIRQAIWNQVAGPTTYGNYILSIFTYLGRRREWERKDVIDFINILNPTSSLRKALEGLLRPRGQAPRGRVVRGFEVFDGQGHRGDAKLGPVEAATIKPIPDQSAAEVEAARQQSSSASQPTDLRQQLLEASTDKDPTKIGDLIKELNASDEGWYWNKPKMQSLRAQSIGWEGYEVTPAMLNPDDILITGGQTLRVYKVVNRLNNEFVEIKDLSLGPAAKIDEVDTVDIEGFALLFIVAEVEATRMRELLADTASQSSPASQKSVPPTMEDLKHFLESTFRVPVQQASLSERDKPVRFNQSIVTGPSYHGSALQSITIDLDKCGVAEALHMAIYNVPSNYEKETAEMEKKLAEWEKVTTDLLRTRLQQAFDQLPASFKEMPNKGVKMYDPHNGSKGAIVIEVLSDRSEIKITEPWIQNVGNKQALRMDISFKKTHISGLIPGMGSLVICIGQGPAEVFYLQREDFIWFQWDTAKKRMRITLSDKGYKKIPKNCQKGFTNGGYQWQFIPESEREPGQSARQKQVGNIPTSEPTPVQSAVSLEKYGAQVEWKRVVKEVFGLGWLRGVEPSNVIRKHYDLVELDWGERNRVIGMRLSNAFDFNKDSLRILQEIRKAFNAHFPRGAKMANQDTIYTLIDLDKEIARLQGGEWRQPVLPVNPSDWDLAARFKQAIADGQIQTVEAIRQRLEKLSSEERATILDPFLDSPKRYDSSGSIMQPGDVIIYIKSGKAEHDVPKEAVALARFVRYSGATMEVADLWDSQLTRHWARYGWETPNNGRLLSVAERNSFKAKTSDSIDIISDIFPPFLLLIVGLTQYLGAYQAIGADQASVTGNLFTTFLGGSIIFFIVKTLGLLPKSVQQIGFRNFLPVKINPTLRAA